MVEVMYVEARRKFDVDNVNYSVLDSLPKGKVSLGATVQYLDLIPIVKEYLEKKGREVRLKKGAYYDGHVLGCNAGAFDVSCEVCLLLCDGKFHAVNNAILLKREVYVFNSEDLEVVRKKDILDYKKKLEGKKKKFLLSEKVGILVSGKVGQNFGNVGALRRRLEEKGKKVYVFEGDNIDLNEFENYKDIGIFINSACFGLAQDSSGIINLSDVLEFI